jgi:DNA-binding GntR family transcriptional regulator
LREALVELAQRGLLVSELGRGFRVPPLERDDAHELARLDDRWHELLLSHCTNAHLMRLIAQMKPILKRYDALYFGGIERARRSVDEHRRIIAALRAADLVEASRWLSQNWANGAAYCDDELRDLDAPASHRGER